MNLFKQILPGSPRFQEVEFSVLSGWALFFPVKQSYLYFLGFALLLAAFTLRKVVTLKNITLTRFSTFLLLFNGLFIFSAFFSPHPFKSLLFVGDILLVSLWFILFYLEKSDIGRYLRLLAAMISVSSLVVLVFFTLGGGSGPAGQIFKNPILQGIVSALAALVFLHALLQKYSHADLALLGLNFTAVIISASKAAFLGLALYAAVMILSRKRRWLVYFFSILVLLVLLPNPLRRMVGHSLHQDPYVLNRLDIWSMSARMFRHHFWTGVGPDLFMEAAKRFNFPQEKGPARYGKLPESPHSDYWKIIVENGLPGLVFVFVFLFFAIRRMLSPPWFDLPKLLLGFLLLQMLLINYIFNFFFILIIFLLLHDFFFTRQRFVSLQPGFRIFFSSLLIFLVVTLYLFPFLADHFLDAVSREKNIVRRFALLNRAALFSPLDERVPLAKAALLSSFAKTQTNLEAWADAVANLRLAQKLDGYGNSALLLESALFRDLLATSVQYPALAEEILAPLRRAEKNDPFKPFLKLQQAVVLREFGRLQEARRLALAALDLEHEYVAAVVFIHELDGLPAADPALQKRIQQIRSKAKKLRAKPGSYLFNLHQLPDKAAGR
ncbi:MAG: O-antigen ligase family protein [Acidobacteria bacterium]|nr:O-antigen ligase family protein [Acidobacteriota bacterium]MCG2812218.1 O-antigen ligase family protein [Candidatus Aminicenantes bacterium]